MEPKDLLKFQTFEGTDEELDKYLKEYKKKYQVLKHFYVYADGRKYLSIAYVTLDNWFKYKKLFAQDW